jgi:hypothetical protein
MLRPIAEYACRNEACPVLSIGIELYGDTGAEEALRQHVLCPICQRELELRGIGKGKLDLDVDAHA